MARREGIPGEQKKTGEAEKSEEEQSTQLRESLTKTIMDVKRHHIERSELMEEKYNATVWGVAGHPTPVGAKEYAIYQRNKLENSYFIVTGHIEETGEYTIRDIDPLSPPDGWKVQTRQEYLGE